MSEQRKTELRSIARAYRMVGVLTFVSVALIVISFILPPEGVIDPSVFGGVGYLTAFAALWTFIIRSERGGVLTVRKGDMEVTNQQTHSDNPIYPTDNENI